MDNNSISTSNTMTKPNNTIWIILAVVAVVLVIIIAAVIASGNSNKDDSTLVPANSTASPEPTYTTAPSDVVFSTTLTPTPQLTLNLDLSAP